MGIYIYTHTWVIIAVIHWGFPSHRTSSWRSRRVARRSALRPSPRRDATRRWWWVTGKKAREGGNIMDIMDDVLWKCGKNGKLVSIPMYTWENGDVAKFLLWVNLGKMLILLWGNIHGYFFLMIIFSNFHKANLETANVRSWVLWDDSLGLEHGENSVRWEILHLAPEVENP